MPNAKPDLKPKADSLEAGKGNWDYVQWCFENCTTPFFPKGSHYFSGGPIHVPAKIGARYRTDGGLSSPVGLRHSDHDKLPGNRTRLVNLDPGPMFVIHGFGTTFLDPIELYGDGESAAIQILSCEGPPTTRSRFENIAFANWGRGIEACGDTKNKDNDQHADDVLIKFCDYYGGGEFIRLDNQQAVNWVAEDCAVRALDTDKKNGPVKFCNAQRGGNFTAIRPLILNDKCRLLEWGDYSPNTCQFKVLDFKRDRMAAPGHYLEIVKKAGDGSGCHYDLEVSGNILEHPDFPIDQDRFYNVPSNLSRLQWDVSGVRVRR